jgi:hypothetical protein
MGILEEFEAKIDSSLRSVRAKDVMPLRSLKGTPDEIKAIAALERFILNESSDTITARGAIAIIADAMADKNAGNAAGASLFRIMDKTDFDKRSDAIAALTPLRLPEVWNFLLDMMAARSEKVICPRYDSSLFNAITALGEYGDPQAALVLTPFLDTCRQMSYCDRTTFLISRLTHALAALKAPAAVPELETTMTFFSENNEWLLDALKTRTSMQSNYWEPFIHTIEALSACGISTGAVEHLIGMDGKPSAYLTSQNPHVAGAVNGLCGSIRDKKIDVYTPEQLKGILSEARMAFSKKLVEVRAMRTGGAAKPATVACK